MFVFEKIEGSDSSFLEFEITGSTYEPIGDVFLRGQKIKGSDFETLHEMSTICIMCNDSAIDFNDFKQAFEKVITVIIVTLLILKIASLTMYLHMHRLGKLPKLP